MRIARTEGNRISNQAAFDAQREAKAKGADVVKQWDASLDGNTRDSHRRVDGEIRELDEKFSNGLLFPCDPNGSAAEVINCRCKLQQRAKWAMDEEELAILKERAEILRVDKKEQFEEFKSKYLKIADEIPLIELAMQTGIFTYTKEQIEEMAQQTNDIANKHVENESKWSGKVVIDNSGIIGGKAWNCDIIVQNETAPLILIHEHLHAHSISYFDFETYLAFRNIEEGTVQFMAEEICKSEGIEVIVSQAYKPYTDALRSLNKKLKISTDDYSFAKQLIEIPVPERLEWLEEIAYNYMRGYGNISQYGEVNKLIDILR